jgi:hypothetical protein
VNRPKRGPSPGHSPSARRSSAHRPPARRSAGHGGARVSSRRGIGLTVIAFGLAFAGTLLIALLQGEKPFYFDSGQYWLLGESFTHNGHFSLLNFEPGVRGYALPLMDHLLQNLANETGWSPSTTAKLFNALTFALLGAVVAPKFAETAWPEQHWGLAPRMALVALTVIFWSGFLNFPLSDFAGLTIALVALVAVAHPDTPGWMLLAGLAGGLALNVRAAFLLLVPVLVLLIAWAWLEQRGTRHASIAHRTLCVGLFAAGFIVVSLPQSLSAHKYYGTWSPVPGAGETNLNENLRTSLDLQRYGAYVGPGEPGVEMQYGDRAGHRLLLEQPGGKITGNGQYVELIFSHPIAMGALFMRHIVNMLDQRYTTPYVESLDTPTLNWLRLVGFLLVFLALARVLWPTARRRLGPARWRYPAALLLCCLTVLPQPPETRYLLAVYLLSYILVLTPGWPNPVGEAGAGPRRWRTPAILVASYLVFMVAVLHVTAGASSQLQFR